MKSSKTSWTLWTTPLQDCRSADRPAKGAGLKGGAESVWRKKTDATEHLRQEESCKVSSDLEAELELLRTTLEMKGAELQDVIQGESQRKEAELQVRDATKLFPFPSLNSGYFFKKNFN